MEIGHKALPVIKLGLINSISLAKYLTRGFMLGFGLFYAVNII